MPRLNHEHPSLVRKRHWDIYHCNKLATTTQAHLKRRALGCTFSPTYLVNPAPHRISCKASYTLVTDSCLRVWCTSLWTGQCKDWFTRYSQLLIACLQKVCLGHRVCLSVCAALFLSIFACWFSHSLYFSAKQMHYADNSKARHVWMTLLYVCASLCNQHDSSYCACVSFPPAYS